MIHKFRGKTISPQQIKDEGFNEGIDEAIEQCKEWVDKVMMIDGEEGLDIVTETDRLLGILQAAKKEG